MGLFDFLDKRQPNPHPMFDSMPLAKRKDPAACIEHAMNMAAKHSQLAQVAMNSGELTEAWLFVARAAWATAVGTSGAYTGEETAEKAYALFLDSAKNHNLTSKQWHEVRVRIAKDVVGEWIIQINQRRFLMDLQKVWPHIDINYGYKV